MSADVETQVALTDELGIETNQLTVAERLPVVDHD
jgi:hypothetical protein